MHKPESKVMIGILLAVFATLIWAGNFIIARGVIDSIPPVTLAFYRWLTATVIIFPFAWKHFVPQLALIRNHLSFFLLTAITGVSMFNTFVYIAGHYSTAINLALIGTTTSPIMSVFLAALILKEKLSVSRIAGMSICVAGILILLSEGKLSKLLSLSFSRGDLWILAAALAFAVYNIMVRKKPVGMNPLNFLFATFLIGTILLIPFYLVELGNKGGFIPSIANLSVILYLGLGTSVIAFICWNAAIMRLGAGRTALFGNLIPVFSSIAAVFILHEKITVVHIVSFGIVIAGLMVANLRN